MTTADGLGLVARRPAHVLASAAGRRPAHRSSRFAVDAQQVHGSLHEDLPEKGGGRPRSPEVLRTRHGLQKSQTGHCAWLLLTTLAVEDAGASDRLKLSSLAERGVKLELGTLDLCCLGAVHLRAERAAVSSFSENELLEMFDDVAQLVVDDEAPRPRISATFRRLRAQRLLVRVDGAGVLRAGEFALSRLGASIAEHFVREGDSESAQVLTRANLAQLTTSLLETLDGALQAAAEPLDAQQWQSRVLEPLRVTARELARGIERRQRGFDVQQEELQRKVAELLESDWFGAVERCQELLDTVSRTLGELAQLLLGDAQKLTAHLQGIEELAARHAQGEVETEARRVAQEIDRIASWGGQRQRAWGEYHEIVHRYLRDVVRLDPSRALVERLRREITAQRGARFALSIANAPSHLGLRPVEVNLPKPPVQRPKKPREQELSAEAPVDEAAALEAKVVALLQHGSFDLSELTATFTRELEPQARFAMAGRIAEIVARAVPALATRAERPWVNAGLSLELEEWRDLRPGLASGRDRSAARTILLGAGREDDEEGAA